METTPVSNKIVCFLIYNNNKPTKYLLKHENKIKIV